MAERLWQHQREHRLRAFAELAVASGLPVVLRLCAQIRRSLCGRMLFFLQITVSEPLNDHTINLKRRLTSATLRSCAPHSSHLKEQAISYRCFFDRLPHRSGTMCIVLC